MKAPCIALNAHLLSGEASYRSAGIHGYLYNTLAHLPEAAPEFDYILFVGAGHPPQCDKWRVQRAALPTQNPAIRIVWEQALQPFALAQARPDLLHGMAFSLPVLWGGPSVVTIFDLSFLRYPERLSASRRLYLRVVTRTSAQRARRVIAISESGRQEIHALLGVPLDKIDVALPGVDPRFAPLPGDEVERFRQQAGLPERFILFVGTLEPRKNLNTLLRAYTRLPQRDKVKLVLAGAKGWQTGPLFALIEELNLLRDIQLPGYISSEDLPMWYNAAQVFVYPSVYEGFGLPLVEAMACGTPVIASDTTSLPEAVGADGILVPPMKVDAWTEALGHLLDDADARTDLARRGPLHAQQFTWMETARQTAASYRRALNTRGENAS